MPRSKTKDIPKEHKLPTGRPTSYNDDIASEILSEIATTPKGLEEICEPDGMPSARTVYRWMVVNESFRQAYARAKEDQINVMESQILDIADDGSNDWMLRRYGDQQQWVENGEALGRSRLRIDARKWLMAHLKPKKWGDRLDLNHSGEIKTPVIVHLPPKKARA